MLDEIILNALQEDIGSGDFSTLSCVPKEATRSAQLIIKENGVLAGIEVAKRIYEIYDPSLSFEVLKFDGNSVKKGDIAFRVTGSSQAILTTERLVLNCLQRMSGIATLTAKIKKEIEGSSSIILDTRKTTPGIRFLEKWAVKIGGGQNHRFGLYDMIMLKDNHIDYAGGITAAIQRTNAFLISAKKDLKIEIEVRNTKELEEVLRVGGVDRIMFDNFSPENLKEALKIIPSTYETEASGGITLENIRAYADTNVNYISVGALTHSLKSLDLSLKATF